jgi:predicted secreted hydrolase
MKASTRSSRLLCALAAILALVIPIGTNVSSVSAASPAVSFPRDEGPHADSHEWWYFTGHLAGTDAGGTPHSYGFELTVFRSTILFPLTSAYTAHFAVTDITRGTFVFAQRYSLQPDVLPIGGGFNNRVIDWAMSGLKGKNSMTAAFLDLSYGLDLKLNTTKAPALHGNGGIIDYGPFGESYYYSEPRLQTTGTVVDHGVRVPVTGTAWFDHQWGDFESGPGGWDWFSIQLDNGAQYMVYLLKDGSGTIVHTIGTRINADGTATPVDPSQIHETVLGTWTSPNTSYTYSSGWRLDLPGGSLTITPEIRNQELHGVTAPAGKYWEGATAVTGTMNGSAVAGQGYTELTPVGSMPGL